jgi:GxxExxY protein
MGNPLVSPLKIDLLVGDKVIVECKATVQMSEIYKAQLLTYLRFTGLKLGLLINFGSIRVKERISQVVNGL